MISWSRISREVYVRFCERLGVQFLGPTRLDCGAKMRGRGTSPGSHFRARAITCTRSVEIDTFRECFFSSALLSKFPKPGSP